VELLGMRIRVVVVRVRTDGDEHARAVLREDDVTRPVAAAFEPAAAGNIH
jgi:hypothetical protein